MFQTIENYFHQYGNGVLERRDQRLGKSERITIANIAANYMVQEFGLNPKSDSFMAVAKVLVTMFPCFKMSTSVDGIVSIEHNL